MKDIMLAVASVSIYVLISVAVCSLDIHTETVVEESLPSKAEVIEEIPVKEVENKNIIPEITPAELYYVTTNSFVRTSPSEDSEYNTILNTGDVFYGDEENGWVYVRILDGYIKSSECALNLEKSSYQIYSRGFKSYMSYEKISPSSKQGQLQTIAYTEDGFRKVDNRYCVAIGTAVKPTIGQYFDLILENGTVIHAIVSDFKAPGDTESDNMTTHNGCVSEFVVDVEGLPNSVRRSGDVSSYTESWDSPVKEIVLYNIGVL